VEQDAGPEDIHLNGIEMAKNGRNLKKIKKEASQGGC